MAAVISRRCSAVRPAYHWTVMFGMRSSGSFACEWRVTTNSRPELYHAPLDRARHLGWIAPLGVLALAGAVRALRFWDGFTSWAHWDDLLIAVPATQVLAGTFPVHHVGVEYHGAAPAYPLAVWFALTGPSTLAFDVFCWALGVAVAGTGYLLARRLFPPWPALLAGLVLAAPPLVFTRWTTSGNVVYPATLLIGNLILLGTHRLIVRRPAPWPVVLVTGLLAGLGWWTNPLAVVYCAPLAVLALRTGLAWRARFWLFPVGIALGGLPAWIYEAANYPSTRLVLHEPGTAPLESFTARTTMFLTQLSLELVGARATELTTVPFAPPAAVQAIVAGLGVLVLARALLRDRHQLAWLVGARGGGPGTGRSLLWILVVANLALALPTKRTLGITYFLPLYAVLPLWTGELLAWLWGVRRWLGAAAGLGLLGFHVWATWTVTLGRRSEPGWRWSQLRERSQPLVDWLDARGIRHLYYQTGFGPAFELSFLTGMRLTPAHIWHEQVVQHGRAVDAQLAPPIVVTDEGLDELRHGLRALGQSVRETRIGRFVVLETSPRGAHGFAPIPPDRWTLTASHRSMDLGYLVDRDAATRWSTGANQRPGAWVQVDLGASEAVARLDLLTLDWQEVPAGFRVEWSSDGQAWQEAVSVPRYWGPLFFSEQHPFLRVRRGRVQAVFDPVRARFLRVVQTGEAARHAWSARELFVYRPTPPEPSGAPGRTVPEPAELTRALREEGVRFVYANHWLSARVLAAGDGAIGAVGALDSNINVNSYGRTAPDPARLERFRLEPGRALLLGTGADLPGTRRLLEIQGALERETRVGPYPVLLLTRPAVRPPLPRDGWRLTATVGAADADRALDGDFRTRWSAGGPVTPEATVMLDLGRARRVAGLRTRPGSRDAGPSTFVLDGSPDGRVWSAVGPLEWAGPLYWTGYELIRNGRREWTVVFPPTTLRYLRVRPTAPARTWDIEELDLFE